MDLKALGFDIAEGVNDPYLPGDCGIFVTRVDKGSIADGRLRYFNFILDILSAFLMITAYFIKHNYFGQTSCVCLLPE